MKKDKEFIPLEQCEDRGLYRIRARNFNLGIFNEATKGFMGIREKFGSKYVFTEYHEGQHHFPTAAPLEALPEVAPEHIDLVEGYSLCENCGRPTVYAMFPDRKEREIIRPGYKMMVPGEWVHCVRTDCQSPLAVYYQNTLLYDWLTEMGVKYP